MSPETASHREWPTVCAGECIPRQLNRCSDVTGRLGHQDSSSGESGRAWGEPQLGEWGWVGVWRGGDVGQFAVSREMLCLDLSLSALILITSKLVLLSFQSLKSVLSLIYFSCRYSWWYPEPCYHLGRNISPWLPWQPFSFSYLRSAVELRFSWNLDPVNFQTIELCIASLFEIEFGSLVNGFKKGENFLFKSRCVLYLFQGCYLFWQ